MGKTLNELTGPQVFVYKNPGSKVYHLTGGYNQPDVKKAFCGTNIKVQNVIDARDIAPREDSVIGIWVSVVAMLDFESGSEGSVLGYQVRPRNLWSVGGSTARWTQETSVESISSTCQASEIHSGGSSDGRDRHQQEA